MICKSDNPTEVKLTKFQWRVLRIVRAIGPTNYDQVAALCRPPRIAIKRTIYRLRTMGLVERVATEQFDVSDQGREHIRLEQAEVGQ